MTMLANVSIYPLSETCTIASQIQPTDVASLAAAGFETIICNRPDGEAGNQPAASDIAKECEARGIAFHYIPVGHGGIRMDLVEAFRDAVTATDGSVLAYCRSGQRSAVLWQASGSP